MKGIFIILLFCSFSVLGQQAYLSHEVEKQVEPTGGLIFLNQFINANLQVPFRSAIKGLNGRVYVKGIIEPDGSMTHLEVVKGMDSLCNQEAIRLMGLYKAWQPAVLKGEKVRQQFVFPVVFKVAAKANFDSTTFTFTDYFDNKFYHTQDPARYEYRIIRAVDDRGFIKADVISQQKNGKKWNTIGTVAFKRNEIWHKYISESKRDSIKVYALSAKDENQANYASEATFQMNGRLLVYKEYSGDNKISRFSEYDLNGLLRRLEVYLDSSYTELVWYDNGQMRSVVERPLSKNFVTKEPIYINLWERDGTQKVKEGDGLWFSKSVDSTGETYVEEGKVAAGKKEGKWVGKWSDGKLHYEETYASGSLLQGVSYDDGIQRTYTQSVINPEFKDGVNNFYKFLGQNIKYPMEAARRGITGRVQLSFVVCEDGSLCEYKVENGIGFGLDDEALRVVKKMSGMWNPGVLRGKKVRVRYNLPINFQVQ